MKNKFKMSATFLSALLFMSTAVLAHDPEKTLTFCNLSVKAGKERRAMGKGIKAQPLEVDAYLEQKNLPDLRPIRVTTETADGVEIERNDLEYHLKGSRFLCDPHALLSLKIEAEGYVSRKIEISNPGSSWVLGERGEVMYSRDPLTELPARVTPYDYYFSQHIVMRPIPKKGWLERKLFQR